MRNLTDEHTTYAPPITPDVEKRIMQAINNTGRSPRWFNWDAACNWLARHPQASADTAVALYDYTVPRTIVAESWYTNDDVEQYVTTECWREWEGRVWHVTFDEDPGTSEPLIREVDAPGSDERPYMTEAEHYANDCRYDDGDKEPTLADLGL